ncbi:MAG: hypothetical protein C0404_13670, partial [Verrucomicrobia bacterium]|nr:hypothetical protein [Verrucomicrobiota bacterium]
MVIVCLKDRIVFANDRTSRELGYGLEELCHPRFTFLGMVASEDRGRVASEFLKCLESGGEIDSVEVRLVAKNGQKQDCIISARRTVFGKQPAVLSVLTDISTLKRTARALKETGERYRELFVNAPMGIFRTTPSGRVVVANPAILKMLGYDSFDDLAKIDLAKCYHPDIPRSLFIEQMEEYGEVIGFEAKWQRKDGSILSVRENARAVRDETGRTLYYEGTVEDISEQKSIQADLFQRREFDRLITSIASGFVNMAASDLDEGINESLKLLGEFMGVDRAYVFIFSQDGITFDNTHEWTNKGIEPHVERLKGIPVRDFWWLNSRILNRDIVYVPRVKDLPPEAAVERKEFEREDIQSLILVPLVCRTSVLGFVGFDSVRTERQWDDDTMTLFRLVAEIFASAIERKKVSDDLKFRMEFEKLVTAISARFVNIAPSQIDAVISDSLAALGEFVRVDCVCVFRHEKNEPEMLK